MNKNEEVNKTRDHIYNFLHFDKLACHILSEYYSESDMVLEFKLDYDNENVSFEIIGNNIEIIWNKNKSVKYDKIDKLTKVSNKYEKNGINIIRIKGELLAFSCCSNNIIKVINWNYYLKDLSNAFCLCNKLVEVPNYIPTSVQSMRGMFEGCHDLTCDLSEWNVFNVKNMSRMFSKCFYFNSDISKWNVSNVEDMYCMFDNCHKFNSDISKWNVSNVRDISFIFYNCLNFSSDLSKWNVSNVRDMHFAFDYCNINLKEEYIPKFNKN